jgi:hypothetical protein
VKKKGFSLKNSEKKITDGIKRIEERMTRIEE